MYQDDTNLTVATVTAQLSMEVVIHLLPPSSECRNEMQIHVQPMLIFAIGIFFAIT